MLFWEIKEKERTFCAEAPGLLSPSHRGSLAGLENRGGTGGRNPAWGLTGGGEEVGEKQEEGERDLGVSLVGRRMA